MQQQSRLSRWDFFHQPPTNLLLSQPLLLFCQKDFFYPSVHRCFLSDETCACRRQPRNSRPTVDRSLPSSATSSESTDRNLFYFSYFTWPNLQIPLTWPTFQIPFTWSTFQIPFTRPTFQKHLSPDPISKCLSPDPLFKNFHLTHFSNTFHLTHFSKTFHLTHFSKTFHLTHFSNTFHLTHFSKCSKPHFNFVAI